MLRLPRLLLTSLLVGLVLLLSPQTIKAQEPECPDGFHWERLSGVGCVQTDCMDIANAHYSYTKSCICNDGFQACYEPIDVTGINCGPNCPFSILVACVPPESTCPNELPAATEIEEPAGADNEEPANETMDLENTAQPDEDVGPAEERPPMLLPEQQADTPSPEVDIVINPDLAGLVQTLTEFLAGQGINSPTPGQAASAGTALAALLGSWVLIQMLSGVPARDALKAIDQWRRGAVAPPADAEPGRSLSRSVAEAPAVVPQPAGNTPSPPGDVAGPAGAPLSPGASAAEAASEISRGATNEDKLPWTGKTHHFEMRVVNTMELGGFGAGMTMAVDIRAIYKDETGAKVRSAPVRYRFFGGGVTFGLTAKSGNFGGDWEYFRTINPVGLNAFEGVGSYKNKGTFSLGIGVTGPTEIWFQDTATRVRPTGKFTKGIGASYWSAYVGLWKRM
ncbi:MAG: hypothetical protein H6651_18525 [Ardenticatenales bacterium]|nr:hypothetical protein [Ardenticatenales bacterium]